MARLTPLQMLRITAQARQDWYEAMARALDDGKPVQAVLQRLHAEYLRSGQPLAPLLQELLQRMAGTPVAGRQVPLRVTVGTDLAGLVPATEAQLIDAGESSGRLANGFAHAAGYLRTVRRLRAEVVGPLQEPLLLILMLLVVLVFFSVEVLPVFTAIAPRTQWPPAARLYGGLADHALLLAVLVIGVLVAGGFGFLRLASRWTGRGRVLCDRHVFPFTLATRLQGAALLASLSGFVAAGLPFDAALQQLHSGSSRYMRAAYAQLRRGLRDAATPEEALCRLHLIDVRYHWMIRLYADSSDFAGAMARIAQEVTEQAVHRTRATFAAVNLVLKLMVAAFVVWTMGSLLGIVQTVRSSAALTPPAASTTPGPSLSSTVLP
jgi:type II secretory pathway component PulF